MAAPSTPGLRARRTVARGGRVALLASAAASGAVFGAASGAASGAVLGATADAAPASYRMEARTTTGMGAAASGPAMMRMLMGGGGDAPSASRSLELRLSSVQPAPAAPQAEHLIPAGLGLGPALPLLTPPPAPASRDSAPDPSLERPSGRLILFRGCAGSAAADRPEVIDLASLMPDQRQLAQALARQKRAGGPVGSARGTTGTWPHGQNDRPLPTSASLVGDHRVQSNYAPEIRFQVDSGHDFLAPLQLTSRRTAGAIELSWNAIPTALGSQAMAFGGGASGDVVLWTSSTAPWIESSVRSDLDAATARSLISKGVLLAPEQTRCTIGTVAAQQLGSGIVTLTAYGDTLRLAGPASAPGRPPLWRLSLVRDSVSTLPLFDLASQAEEAPGGQPAGEAPATPDAPQRRSGWGLIPGLF